MKQSIEKKLGCTIEEYAALFKERREKGYYIEGEQPNDLEDLTDEELVFMMQYSKEHKLSA